ncbi:Heat shock protein 70 [Oopsacas minuta]|uniref:Heat shock protein 70 n=1 Tax=Oopsacas minuta TaxID=111878 RepID=A0AAV7K6I8_9METZ|nr:Heat shock protein 70 [Oopsacas minuta]
MASKGKGKGKLKKKTQPKPPTKPPPPIDTPCLFSVSIGTQNICIATVRNAILEIIVNENGDRLTPASICYEVGKKGQFNPLIGQVASQLADRGEPNAFTHLLDFEKMSENCCKTNFQDSSLKLVAESSTQNISHVRILSDFLSAVRETVSAYSNKTATHCIIAHSSQVSMETLRNACNIAALSPIQILPASICPLLAYGIGQNKDQLEIPKIALVIDLGHRYLGVSIYRILNGLFQPIKTEQFQGLGGEKFDEILTNHIASLFNDKHKCDLYENRKSILKIAREVSNIKHILSTLPIASVSIDSLYEGIDCHLSIARGRFESLISPIITRLVEIVTSTVLGKDMELECITDLVCVGGSCRIPFIQSQLQGAFSSATLHNTLTQDEVFALGAAKQCQLIEENTLVSDFKTPPISVPSTMYDIVLKIDIDILLFQSGTPLPATNDTTLEVAGPRTFSIIESRNLGNGTIDIPEGVKIVSLRSELNAQTGLKHMTSETILDIHTGAVVCADTILIGQVTIGANTVVHPKATLDGSGGPIVIGQNNILEENVVIKGTEIIEIGSGNSFRVGTHCHAKKVGDNNIFEMKSLSLHRNFQKTNMPNQPRRYVSPYPPKTFREWMKFGYRFTFMRDPVFFISAGIVIFLITRIPVTDEARKNSQYFN